MPCDIQVRDGVATLSLSSSENRNALGYQLTSELRDHVRDSMSDPGVRVVVITGTGHVFSAGWDLKMNPEEGIEVDGMLVDLIEQIRLGPKPVVARVNGSAFGGALGLVAACDLSVAAEGARFAFPEVRMGMAPTTAAVQCLPKMRVADALELVLTGSQFSAARAAEIGLINRAVDPGALDSAVAEYVDALLLGGPVALSACKQLARAIRASDSMARELALEYNRTLVGSPEALEGVAAFTEKRPPAWSRQR